MESANHYKRMLFSAIVFVFPISVLLYNYTVSKLSSFEVFSGGTIMLLFLFVWSFIISRNKYMYTREVIYLLSFFVFSLPAYIMSSFGSTESYIRYFALISFVPLGFLTGQAWGARYNSVDGNKGDILLSILLIPAFVTAFVIINGNIITGYDINRDYVFGLVVFLPLLLYYKKNLLPILFLIVVTVICFISSKRSGLLCVFSIIPFMLIIKTKAIKHDIIRLLSVIIVLGCVIYVASRLLPNIDLQIEYSIERLKNLDDESSDSRLLMYEKTAAEIRNSGFINVLFGHGCMGTVNLLGNPTHNDYLEILYDYGLIPLLCIIMFLISLFIRFVKVYKKDHVASLILLSTLFIFGISTGGNCMFTNAPIVFILLFTLGFALTNLRTSRI